MQTPVPEPAFEIANLINDEPVAADNEKAVQKPQNRHSWTPGETRGRRNRGRRGR